MGELRWPVTHENSPHGRDARGEQHVHDVRMALASAFAEAVRDFNSGMALTQRHGGTNAQRVFCGPFILGASESLC